jgi:4-cresol dehydrogenase (hydroxylating)
MDLIAEQYDANDSALRTTIGRINNVLDPHGILAPGKQEIWPPEAREEVGTSEPGPRPSR